MKRRRMLVADLLCGAGGSSTGCARALADLGLEMELVCVNHWDVAIETHRRNHPEARHHVQDIAAVRPHLIVPEGYLDLLMASPTCTHHSVARGGKPTSDQQRSDPWHIITWLTELRVKRMIIENVWEFTGWGPVDPRTGKAIRSRKGEYFRAWIETIRRLGFEPEWRKLNAADYGEATTRSRFILKARFDRVSIGWAPKTHAKRSDDLLLFPSLQPWRPARDIIDWSLKGRSIFGRKKPLAPKTLARIYAGAVKFRWPEPFLVVLRNHMGGQSVDLPLPTIAARGTHIGLAQPTRQCGIPTFEQWHADTKSLGGTREEYGRLYLSAEEYSRRYYTDNVKPFVLATGSTGRARSTDDPIPTVTTDGAHALISPYYGSGSGKTCRSAEEPLPTVTGKARVGMVVPITHVDGSNRARDVATDPLPTLTTANRGELAFVTACHGERQGQAPRVHDLAAPLPTITASGHVDLVEPAGDCDILFRMLEPHELAAAMGFVDDDAAYAFAGTKTEQVRQIGNAVSVRLMRAEVAAIMQDAAAKPAERPKVQRRTVG